MTLAVLMLAAGQGKRMLSKRQKILHEVGGKPMVTHLFETAVSISDILPVIVVGQGETGVQGLLGDQATYVVQPEALGTGHAVQVAADTLRGRADQVVVTYGDMPLLRADTLLQMAKMQRETNSVMSMLSVMGDVSSTFGRVLRNDNGRVVEIVEVAEAKRRENSAELLAILELNAGLYCFDADWLWQNIHDLPLRQARSGVEYYLTDMLETAVKQGHSVAATVAADADECLGAGTRAEMVAVEAAFRRRANQYWLNHSVTLVDPASIFIDSDVIIGQDTIIWPNTYLQGKTQIGEDCVLGPNSIIRNANIGDGCHIEQAVVENATVDSKTTVPSFTHLK